MSDCTVKTQELMGKAGLGGQHIKIYQERVKK